MSRFIKLPENLKAWKIVSRLSDNNGSEVYRVNKKEYDGTSVSAILKYVNLSGESYTAENIEFINEEADFLKSISKIGNCFNYIDVAVNNYPAKEILELFIITEDLKSLKNIMESKSFDEPEIINFGIQLSEILEKLEANNIYHGNLNTENIYLTNDGKYKLGGFSDFESKITDMSFVAPEIYKNEDADFTTDIYSLGLIMYYMSNGYSLPFESGTILKDDAIKLRLDGKSVSAPVNGSEKLKSVIVIACQPSNENRWKNAGNIKNALTSIKSEANVAAAQSIIVPETTDFESNVFEEYDFEEFDETAKAASEVFPLDSALPVETTDENKAEAIMEEQQTTEGNVKDETIEIQPEDNTSSSNDEADFETIDAITLDEDTSLKNELFEEVNVESDEFEIDNRVFDSFEIHKKAKSFQQQAKEKDYGDYFEETVPAKTESKTPDATEYDVDNDKDYNVFEENMTENDSEHTGKSNKNSVIIAVCVVVILAALGFVAYCIINGISNQPSSNHQTTSPSEATTVMTTEATTAEPTTEPQTTVEPTTVTIEKNVIPVVGYGYSYAKKLLEQEGFIVEIGEYDYSTEWPEGYVIAQSPLGDTTAETGTVVTLDISLGLKEPETTPPATEAPTEAQVPDTPATDNSYIFSNSDSAYLSKAEVSALSRENLNLALNEIYAKRGRIFKDATLSSYFNSKSWYEPKYTANEFSENVTFNKYERTNLQLLIDEQKNRGYR